MKHMKQLKKYQILIISIVLLCLTIFILTQTRWKSYSEKNVQIYQNGNVMVMQLENDMNDYAISGEKTDSGLWVYEVTVGKKTLDVKNQKNLKVEFPKKVNEIESINYVLKDGKKEIELYEKR